MSNKQLLVVFVYIIIMECWAYGWGYMAANDKQEEINVQLQKEYDELKENYADTEEEYILSLKACFEELGD